MFASPNGPKRAKSRDSCEKRPTPKEDCRQLITSERAQRAERVFSNLREKSEYSRPGPARPGPITLFKVLYLRNRISDRQAVFFDEYHLDVKVVWHGYRIASVPVMAHGACQTWGTLDDPQNILPQ